MNCIEFAAITAYFSHATFHDGSHSFKDTPLEYSNGLKKYAIITAMSNLIGNYT